MPHQCVHCKRIIPIGSKELLEGCQNCKGKFFFYIRDEQLEKIRKEPIVEIPKEDKKKIEQDVREIAGITDEDAPVILDLESVRAIGSGKFEIDLSNLFRKDRPLIYKMEEGKYIIDLATTLKKDARDIKGIIDPEKEN
jgi:predicted  nucleic acid-binding Zn-ribbon protein